MKGTFSKYDQKVVTFTYDDENFHCEKTVRVFSNEDELEKELEFREYVENSLKRSTEPKDFNISDAMKVFGYIGPFVADKKYHKFLTSKKRVI